MDAGNILKPRLARGELHLVGATTLKEYRTEKDPALERRFQPVKVGEPSIEDAVLILQGLAPPTRSTTASSTRMPRCGPPSSSARGTSPTGSFPTRPSTSSTRPGRGCACASA